jgi:hypothetical protein
MTAGLADDSKGKVIDRTIRARRGDSLSKDNGLIPSIKYWLSDKLSTIASATIKGSSVKDEGLPRWRNILTTSRIRGRPFETSPAIGDLTTGLIAYASIALGFCVAGLTISLTLPDRDFASPLATLKRPGQSTNSYSDLLFCFLVDGHCPLGSNSDAVCRDIAHRKWFGIAAHRLFCRLSRANSPTRFCTASDRSFSNRASAVLPRFR